MVGIDTNILVRLITGDDPEQTRHAVHLLEEETVFVPKTVLLESEWVLRSAYGLERSRIHQALARFLELPNVVVEDKESVQLAMGHHAQGLDFADALHLASARCTTHFATYDTSLIKQGSRMSLPVFNPRHPR